MDSAKNARGYIAVYVIVSTKKTGTVRYATNLFKTQSENISPFSHLHPT